MKLIKKYNKALEATYEHVGLKEDWVVCPLDTESLEISSEQVDIEFLMKEYAKLKCQELLEIVANEALVQERSAYLEFTPCKSIDKGLTVIEVNKDSILNAVDLNEFIK